MSTNRIFLTGGNGFLGSHVLKQLLAQPGVSVRAVVRSESKVQVVKDDFGSFSNLDFAVVPDFTMSNSFDDALSKTEMLFDTVIHCASPALFKATSDNRDFLEPAVKGTIELLKSVKAVAPNVRRVIATSSIAAVGDLLSPEKVGGKLLTEQDWNSVIWEEASSGSLVGAYLASKKFAEEAAWTFMKEEKPNFDLVTICPPMIYGPLAHTIKSMSELNQSNTRIYQSFMNSRKHAELPPNGVYYYVDPRDLAAAHIAAMIIPEAGGNRFIVSAGPLSSQLISDTLRAAFPELKERTPIGSPGKCSLPDEAERYGVSSAKAKRVLGIHFRSVDDTLKDLGSQLHALEKAGV